MKNANFPTFDRNEMVFDNNVSASYLGYTDKMINFVEDFVVSDTEMWKVFVEQFRIHSDVADAGWRGEYWGKMMRGACFLYSYNRSEELYKALTDAVTDLLSTPDELGRISTYDVDHEFDGWDVWSRKYVMLGLQYYIEICRDEALIEKIVKTMCAHADYIISKLGRKEDGKKPITDATRHWRGVNSSSILEPFVRLYNLTKEQRYFDFAKYILDNGLSSVVDIVELAYKNELYPYQFPVTKAYETVSCFEGVIELYRITGDERLKTAVLNFANKVLESDFTIIGCAGCTHELFDHSTVRQANTHVDPVQETCVTVTLMKFFYQLTMITGDAKFADAFERSMYNAYFGSVNTEMSVEQNFIDRHPGLIPRAMPFDSYSPLTAGKRGLAIGGFKIMPGGYYYGCCACIGALGMGLIPKMNVMKRSDGLAINLYIPGKVETVSAEGEKVALTFETAYPADGKVKITVDTECDKVFTVAFRIPNWSKNTTVNGANAEAGYYEIRRNWNGRSTVELDFDMTTRVISPIPYGTQVLMNEVIWGHNYIIPAFDREDPLAKTRRAFERGPLVLAIENRLGHNVDEPINIHIEGDTLDAHVSSDNAAPYENQIEMYLTDVNGKHIYMTDYASAGKLWNEESKMAAWIGIKELYENN